MAAATPNSRNSLAVREMRSATISVDRPGPPYVMTKITSKTLNASMRRKSPVTISTGIISGSLIYLISCHPVAPLILAASKAERGVDYDAASDGMKIYGVHCQISVIITNNSACCPGQSTLSNPMDFRVLLIVPTAGWYI